MKSVARCIFCLTVMVTALHSPLSAFCAAAEGLEAGFEIKGYEITGNTIFPAGALQNAVAPFTGPGKNAPDVEKARDAVEKIYHDRGYPAAMVNIPEQTLKNGIVKLQVIETRIGRVRVTGSRYFTIERILRDLPSLTPGQIFYYPAVQKELGRLNSNQDIKVSPVLSAGSETGTIDVELKVEDKLPLHGYLELNNRATPNTTELRLNALIRYDNLWQRGHSLSLQFQTSPQDTSQFDVFAGSYILPAPWNADNQLVFFGVWSNSNTAFSEGGTGFDVVGKGEIFGGRYAVPLPHLELYSHSVTLGMDFKHFSEAVGYTLNGVTTTTPATYLPFSFSYSSSLPDKSGVSQFGAGVNLALRGLLADQGQFELKRYMASANYVYVIASAQRSQKLPLGMGLLARADGQLADMPLIDDEEYIAGGMESVRAYRESVASGDNAVHGTLELSFPDPLQKSGIGKTIQVSPYVFYDYAYLVTKDPLPGQLGCTRLQGPGVGIRGSMWKNLEYEVDWAAALSALPAATPPVSKYEERVDFKVKEVF